jgi:hypothetical protein
MGWAWDRSGVSERIVFKENGIGWDQVIRGEATRKDE